MKANKTRKERSHTHTPVPIEGALRRGGPPHHFPKNIFKKSRKKRNLLKKQWVRCFFCFFFFQINFFLFSFKWREHLSLRYSDWVRGLKNDEKQRKNRGKNGKSLKGIASIRFCVGSGYSFLIDVRFLMGNRPLEDLYVALETRNLLVGREIGILKV